MYILDVGRGALQLNFKGIEFTSRDRGSGERVGAQGSRRGGARNLQLPALTQPGLGNLRSERLSSFLLTSSGSVFWTTCRRLSALKNLRINVQLTRFNSKDPVKISQCGGPSYHKRTFRGLSESRRKWSSGSIPLEEQHETSSLTSGPRCNPF